MSILDLSFQDLKGNSLKLSEITLNQKAFIYILRRFGCKLCRLESIKISSLKPALDAIGVKLIGICHDANNYQEFVRDGYFLGDLYLDPTKSIYSHLGLGASGKIAGAKDIISKAGRDRISQASNMRVSGNFTGDGFQLGGVVIIDSDGKYIFEFKQQQGSDSCDLEKVTSSLGLDKELFLDIDDWENWSR